MLPAGREAGAHDPSPVDRPSPTHTCRRGIRDEPPCGGARFGVSSSSVIRWVAEWRASDRDHALTQGGDRRSHRIEAWSDFLLAEVEAQGDISLVELADRLATTHGVRFAPSTIWRCLDRHAMTIKKKQRTPASRHGPTSHSGARPGSTVSLTLIRPVWSSSTKSPFRRRWSACVGGHVEARAAGCPCPTGTGKPRCS